MDYQKEKKEMEEEEEMRRGWRQRGSGGGALSAAHQWYESESGSVSAGPAFMSSSRAMATPGSAPSPSPRRPTQAESTALKLPRSGARPGGGAGPRGEGRGGAGVSGIRRKAVNSNKKAAP